MSIVFLRKVLLPCAELSVFLFYESIFYLVSFLLYFFLHCSEFVNEKEKVFLLSGCYWYDSDGGGAAAVDDTDILFWTVEAVGVVAAVVKCCLWEGWV